jgi:hypothetical protein
MDWYIYKNSANQYTICKFPSGVTAFTCGGRTRMPRVRPS